jgi:maleylpyruvate isomerase
MRPEEFKLAELRAWLDLGTHFLASQVDQLGGDDISRPSRLSGWTIGHLLTHLARNADALGNLVRWAATGIETPMYPGGPEQRLADLEKGALREPAEILRDVRGSAAGLSVSLDALPDGAWHRVVRTAQGRQIPAAQIPWLRIWEVWIHTMDLGTGGEFSEIPQDLAVALLEDVLSTLATRPGCPALTIRAESGAILAIPSASAPDPIEVKGTVPELLGWLTGRADGAGLDFSPERPALPAWL